MTAIKNYLSKKGVGYYLVIPTLVIAILALIYHNKTGITVFNTKLSPAAVYGLWISIGLLVVSLVFDLKPIRYLAYLVCFYGFLGYVATQVTLITNVLVSIDGTTFDQGFILTMVFFVLSFVLMLLCALLTNWKPWAKKVEEDKE